MLEKQVKRMRTCRPNWLPPAPRVASSFCANRGVTPNCNRRYIVALLSITASWPEWSRVSQLVHVVPSSRGSPLSSAPRAETSRGSAGVKPFRPIPHVIPWARWMNKLWKACHVKTLGINLKITTNSVFCLHRENRIRQPFCVERTGNARNPTVLHRHSLSPPTTSNHVGTQLLLPEHVHHRDFSESAKTWRGAGVKLADNGHPCKFNADTLRRQTWFLTFRREEYTKTSAPLPTASRCRQGGE